MISDFDTVCVAFYDDVCHCGCGLWGLLCSSYALNDWGHFLLLMDQEF